MDRVEATGKVIKRKAESQDNERLSKRLSLLNLERNGQKLYVPVEQPSSAASSKPKTKTARATSAPQDDYMQLDDSKHKVYIYDLDAELSDSDTSDDGRLVFLPDIEKHLRETRIPPMVMANSEGELAGNTQLVLYNVPSSLTVPKEQDSVRKAIIETRARARAKQETARRSDSGPAETGGIDAGLDARDWYKKMVDGHGPSVSPSTFDAANGWPVTSGPVTGDVVDDDPDAMDIG